MPRAARAVGKGLAELNGPPTETMYVTEADVLSPSARVSDLEGFGSSRSVSRAMKWDVGKPDYLRVNQLVGVNIRASSGFEGGAEIFYTSMSPDIASEIVPSRMAWWEKTDLPDILYGTATESGYTRPFQLDVGKANVAKFVEGRGFDLNSFKGSEVDIGSMRYNFPEGAPTNDLIRAFKLSTFKEYGEGSPWTPQEGLLLATEPGESIYLKVTGGASKPKPIQLEDSLVAPEPGPRTPLSKSFSEWYPSKATQAKAAASIPKSLGGNAMPGTPLEVLDVVNADVGAKVILSVEPSGAKATPATRVMGMLPVSSASESGDFSTLIAPPIMVSGARAKSSERVSSITRIDMKQVQSSILQPIQRGKATSSVVPQSILSQPSAKRNRQIQAAVNLPATSSILDSKHIQNIVGLPTSRVSNRNILDNRVIQSSVQVNTQVQQTRQSQRVNLIQVVNSVHDVPHPPPSPPPDKQRGPGQPPPSRGGKPYNPLAPVGGSSLGGGGGGAGGWGRAKYQRRRDLVSVPGLKKFKIRGLRL